MLKNLFAAVKISAFLNLSFVPAINVVILLAWFYGDPSIFEFWGFAAFVTNGTMVLTKLRRSWILASAIMISGFAAPTHTPDQPTKG